MEEEPVAKRLTKLARWRESCQPGGWQRVYSLLLDSPPCRYCAGAGQGDLALCAACVRDQPFNDHACSRCAIPLDSAALACADCLKKPPPWAAAATTVRYDYPADWLVRRLKFANDLPMVRPISGLMAGHPPTFLGECRCLVPVPMHWRRRIGRGYDQAAELSRMLGRRMGVPVRRMLRRTRATSPQVGMSAVARRRNLKGAIALRGRPPDGPVCLVDDVLTTGTTAAACARTLLAGGAPQVFVWCFARA
jgi:ComF family protein